MTRDQFFDFEREGVIRTEARGNFMAGVCTGTAQDAFGVPYRAAETKCARAGDSDCVMSLVQAKNS